MLYSANQIEVLSGLEAIRRNVAMYIGPPDAPTVLNQLIKEAMCLMIDEVATGTCTKISVSVASDWTVTIRDNGPGMSMAPTPYGKTTLEMLLTKLTACRAHKQNSRLKKRCCDIGLPAVTALSDWMRVRNCHEGVCWIQEYRKGEAVSPFRIESDTTETGIELSFRLDFSLISGLHYDPEELALWVRKLRIGLTNIKVLPSDEIGAFPTLVFKARKTRF